MLRRLTTVTVTIGVLVCLVGARPSYSQQSRPGQPAATAPTGTGVMRGLVTAADSGRPLRRARVVLQGAGLREQRATTTDENGRWELKNLPAGRYTLTITKPSYVMLQFGQRIPWEPGKQIELRNGETLNSLDARLPAGGVIAGRILDDLAEPAAFMFVQPYRMEFFNGRRQLAPAGGPVRTNDLGEYRIAGLPPGDYYVGNQVTFFGGSSADDEGVAIGASYFPGTADEATARPITVRAGQTRANVDFPVSAVQLARVSGVVIDSEGKLLSGADVSLQQMRAGASYASMITMQGATTGADGRFAIYNIPPGNYWVASTGTAASPLTATEQGAVNVNVKGADIDDIAVQLFKGSKVTGQIEFEGDERPSLAPSLRIYTTEQSPGPSSMPGRSTVHEDWSFEMNSISPGDRFFRILNLPAGYALKSVFVNGEDVIDTPTRFDGKEEMAGVRLVVTSRPTEIAGTVNDEKGQPAREYNVLVFPRDRSKWDEPLSRRMGSVRPDQNGRFSIMGLPPGEYLVVAVDYLQAGESRDPDFLSSVTPRATVLLLGEAQKTTVELKLTSRTRGGQG